MINLAAQIEGHPDNTSPALSGGLVASAMEGKRVYSVNVPVSEKIRFALMIPPFELKTEEARAALPKTYSREDAVYNLSRSGLMTASLFSGNLQNLRVAVQDRIHQPYRSGLIGHYDDVFRMSYELGSLNLCQRRRAHHHRHDRLGERRCLRPQLRHPFGGQGHHRLAGGDSLRRPQRRPNRHRVSCPSGWPIQ
ncbi:MAG: homoserine kinase [Acutalibacter sp.]